MRKGQRLGCSIWLFFSSFLVIFLIFALTRPLPGRGRVRAVASSSPSRTTISRPKTGPGSRGGKGGYKKKLSSPDVSPHSKKSKN